MDLFDLLHDAAGRIARGRDEHGNWDGEGNRDRNGEGHGIHGHGSRDVDRNRNRDEDPLLKMILSLAFLTDHVRFASYTFGYHNGFGKGAHVFDFFRRCRFDDDVVVDFGWRRGRWGDWPWGWRWGRGGGPLNGDGLQFALLPLALAAGDTGHQRRRVGSGGQGLHRGDDRHAA